MLKHALAGLGLLGWIYATAAASGGAPVVAVEQGRLSGVRQGPVVAFLGVPFAAPPTGDKRWRTPQPASSWEGVRPATAFSASCYQIFPPPRFGPYTAEFLDTPPPAEDCLYLNVWTPVVGDASLPVLVWIHGGGFMGGSGVVPIYNGARLAARGAVVVTINYRLGPFGFLAHPDLSAEDPAHLSGNYGLLDQVAALQWVRKNIARFGGDASNVTIAGQSAGALSVNDLILSPLAVGLFRQAIAESGAGMGIPPKTLEQAESEGVAFARYLGAGSVAALRALPAARIQDAVFVPIGEKPATGDRPKIRWQPVVDGKTIPADASDGRSKACSPVPLLTGYTADENPGFGVAAATDFEDWVKVHFAAHAAAILALYPHASDQQAIASAKALARDRYMASLLLWSRARQATSGQVIYAYRFDYPVPTAQPPGYGAFHTAEVPYLFGVLDTAARPYGPDDRQVSDQVQRYWLNFMQVGDPNGAGLAAWSAMSPATLSVMALDLEPAMRPAVSTPERFEALRAFVADGGSLDLF